MITKRNFLVDGLILIAFLTISEPGLTGLPIHEWLGLGFFAMIVLHLFLHWDWIVQVTVRYFRKFFHSSRMNYIIDLFLLISFVTAMLSGLMISRTVLPLIGIGVVHNSTWRFLHDFSANVMLILVAVHFALHWRWILATSKRWLLFPIKDRIAISALRPATLPVRSEDDRVHYRK